jgi:hypothetical protein
VGPQCSFCGTSTGPFKEVGGLFTLLMCGACQAVRRSGPGLLPIEVVLHANLLEPYLQWPVRSPTAITGPGCAGRLSGTPRPGIPDDRPP